MTTGIDATQVDPSTPATPVEPTAPADALLDPPGVGAGEPPIETIVVLDFGSQYSQLITRRIREAGVYSELVHHDTPWADLERLAPRGVILSGGPASVYEEGAPQLPEWVLASGLPVLGICYGMQLIARAAGGSVDPATRREYGLATITTEGDSPLFAGLPRELSVWMSHGDSVSGLPGDFAVHGSSANAPLAAFGRGNVLGIQFHPEVAHTPLGAKVIENFLVNVCGVAQSWTPASFVDRAVEEIRAQVGEGRVLLGLSGGVDSSVAAALIHKAIGDQLTPVFVNNGLLRQGEAEQVREVFARGFGMPLVYADATDRFLGRLAGVTDPEEKRKIIGDTFVRVFEAEAERAEATSTAPFEFLAQGTLYPDVIESTTRDTKAAAKIKTHHNVGGLPADLGFQLVEPLKYLFKDEVRAVGRELGLPDEIVERQPFPGPGLAVRILGEVTAPDLETLRAADAIVREEIDAAGLGGEVWQYFAVLLPVNTVGVMGDYRTYAKVCAIRAVSSQDAMTADWARLPYDLLARMSTRIVNEVRGINRVVYDISSKPPSTIEWE